MQAGPAVYLPARVRKQHPLTACMLLTSSVDEGQGCSGAWPLTLAIDNSCLLQQLPHAAGPSRAEEAIRVISQLAGCASHGLKRRHSLGHLKHARQGGWAADRARIMLPHVIVL